ncbi:hypothetical protein LLH06_02625 [Mucilaginibacter daejeonensis]|uniref:hypothetical protein n=1 Tax=Mucilaginibacter daejeonensis TaxID=398049 RepID=UPI001D173624|nr:hypothetical protein [Mucilaginibacter daejeonensis]UEG53868.1 hypothetical protein LLH06_02625 [Mucilaginibacter daejeonensis]
MRVLYPIWCSLLPLLLLTNLAFADIPEPKVIRRQLLQALEKKTLTDSLYTVLTAEADKSPLTVAYIGAVQALKAKHAWNPYYKVKYLNDAEKTFKTAVSREPDNIEIRFMRFSIEHNVPGFLGYNKNLTADRDAMITQLNKKHYTSADPELVHTIIKFLIDSDRCTPAQVQKLRSQLAAQ